MIESLDPTPYVEFTYSLECEGGFDEVSVTAILCVCVC